MNRRRPHIPWQPPFSLLAVVSLVAMLAILSAPVFARASTVLAAGSPPLTWPVQSDRSATQTLTWPVAEDARGGETLTWPVAGDVSEASFTVYFSRGGSLEPVSRSMDRVDFCCASVLECLLAGPSAIEQYAGFRSGVPAGYALRRVGEADGVAYVELTRAAQATSAECVGLTGIGQVVYAATELPTIDAVVVEFDGRPYREVEGVELPMEGGLTREEWEELAG